MSHVYHAHRSCNGIIMNLHKCPETWKKKILRHQNANEMHHRWACDIWIWWIIHFRMRCDAYSMCVSQSHRSHAQNKITINSSIIQPLCNAMNPSMPPDVLSPNSAVMSLSKHDCYAQCSIASPWCLPTVSKLKCWIVSTSVRNETISAAGQTHLQSPKKRPNSSI